MVLSVDGPVKAAGQLSQVSAGGYAPGCWSLQYQGTERCSSRDHNFVTFPCAPSLPGGTQHTTPPITNIPCVLAPNIMCPQRSMWPSRPLRGQCLKTFSPVALQRTCGPPSFLTSPSVDGSSGSVATAAAEIISAEVAVIL